MRFSIVCASNNREVLATNLLASPGIAGHDLHIQTGYSNVCRAYNAAMPKLVEDTVIFIHQDVYLPKTFFPQLTHALKGLKEQEWGVLGVAGRKGPVYAGNILDRGSIWGSPEGLPAEVDT